MNFFNPLFWTMLRRAKAGGSDSSAEVLTTLIERSIEKFKVPENITKIGNSAFNSCTSLVEVNLHDSLKTIDNNAFSNCKQLVLHELPASISNVNYYGFINCTGLTEITFKGTPTTIASTAFTNCTNLLTFNVPWSEGEVLYAPWGATNATINYNYVEEA